MTFEDLLPLYIDIILICMFLINFKKKKKKKKKMKSFGRAADLHDRWLEGHGSSAALCAPFENQEGVRGVAAPFARSKNTLHLARDVGTWSGGTCQQCRGRMSPLCGVLPVVSPLNLTRNPRSPYCSDRRGGDTNLPSGHLLSYNGERGNARRMGTQLGDL
jgi:hypothetical protein